MANIETITVGNTTYNIIGGEYEEYSTTEKVVGTWIDGKPVYQKVIAQGSISYSKNGWTTITSYVPNAKMIISAVAFGKDGTNTMFDPLQAQITSGGEVTVRISRNDWYYSGQAGAIIRYTKTTD